VTSSDFWNRTLQNWQSEARHMAPPASKAELSTAAYADRRQRLARWRRILSTPPQASMLHQRGDRLALVSIGRSDGNRSAFLVGACVALAGLVAALISRAHPKTPKAP
jgi:hypothetical protein